MQPLYISYIIIFLNVFISMWAWKNEKILYFCLERPYEVYHSGKWHLLFTSHFIHGDWIHLLFNSITLYYFGPPVERLLGSTIFILVYIIAQLSSGLVTVLIQRNNPHYSSLGSSGAVLGILYIFIVYYPMVSIYLFFIPIGIPAFLFGVVFLIYSLWGTQSQVGHISHEGHLGGAAAGLIIGLFLKYF